jgi:hypothetical protein
LTALTLTSQRGLHAWPSHITALRHVKRLGIINTTGPHHIAWQAHPMLLLHQLALSSQGLESFGFHYGTWDGTGPVWDILDEGVTRRVMGQVSLLC